MTVGAVININKAEWTANPPARRRDAHGAKVSSALTSTTAAIVSPDKAIGQNRSRLVVGVTGR